MPLSMLKMPHLSLLILANLLMMGVPYLGGSIIFSQQAFSIGFMLLTHHLCDRSTLWGDLLCVALLDWGREYFVSVRSKGVGGFSRLSV